MESLGPAMDKLEQISPLLRQAAEAAVLLLPSLTILTLLDWLVR
jgi:hypothetical protein